MAKNEVADWSRTAGDNSDVGGINIAEGWAAANINNSIREVMKQVADWRVQVRQSVDNGNQPVLTGGSSNAYTVAATETLTAVVAGNPLRLRINHQNTGAATLNPDSLGAATIRKYDGASLVDFESGDLRIGDIISVVYNGTYWVLVDHVRPGREPLEVITSWTALSGGANITFTNTNSTKYIGYTVELEGLEPVTNAAGLRCQMSNTGGAPWDEGSADYAISLREERIHNTDPAATKSTGTSVIQVSGALSNDRGSLSGKVHIESPHNADRYTTIRGTTSAIVGAAAATEFRSLGVRLEEANHNAFLFFSSTDDGFQAGQYRILGMLA